MSTAHKYVLFSALLMIFAGTINAEEIKGTISGEVVNISDDSLVCALVLINGEHKTYSCTDDGTNRGAPFTLQYDYFTDNTDTSANKLLVFADGYKNETLQITQPDESVLVQMGRIDNSLVGEWSTWFVNNNTLTPFRLPGSHFDIYQDDGATVEGSWTLRSIRGSNYIYRLTASYENSDALQWAIDQYNMSGDGPFCTDTGTMQRMLNLIIVTNHTKSCWGEIGTEYWVRHSR